MAGHVLDKYDTSADYWRVTKDKDGNIIKIENDGYNDITYLDEYGKETGYSEFKGGSKTDFLGKELGIAQDTANEMLSSAGYTYNQNTGKFEGNNAKNAFDITGNTEMETGPVKSGNLITNGIANVFNVVKNGISSVVQKMTNWLGKDENKDGRDKFDNAKDSQNVGKTVEQWGVGESHCDEYATAVLNEAGVLPYDWPDPAKFTVAEGNNQYWDFYKDELQSSPSEGWNAMLMKDGTVVNGEPLSPHMAAIYVNSDGTISLTHYTGDKVKTSYNWTQTQLQNAFWYKEFGYLSIRGNK